MTIIICIMFICGLLTSCVSYLVMKDPHDETGFWIIRPFSFISSQDFGDEKIISSILIGIVLLGHPLNLIVGCGMKFFGYKVNYQ